MSSSLQQTVQRAIDELVASGAETGLQVAVHRYGEPVVDAVAGFADTGRPMTPDTPIYSASTGKGVTATLANVLVARGVLRYDEPIAELWPEFAAHGKGRATLRHVLTHSVGVPAIPASTTLTDLTDWAGMTAAIADSVPWWEPGTKTAYHAQTFGFLVGELVRRATGRPLAQVLRDELTGPLGVGDEVYFGVPADALDRVARLDEPDGVDEFLADPDEQLAPAAVTPRAASMNRADVLGADVPSAATASARGIATVYSALLDTELIPAEVRRQIVGPAFSGVDEVYGNPAVWALGYAYGRLGAAAEQAATTFGMPGMGGSAAWLDHRSGVAFALTKNRFDPRQATAATDLGQLVAAWSGA
ncbi:serine hydrolase domain-containing protein [Kribbella italica]|uniref:CubicO group peptidase (Beta-lactamase class C family) n=1 Tax=Kribbella italica TaxID=1540520 RepID=A0A7W9MYD5_9ACTN|nr:serine hydrolase domain-containing protein [Kribbella italica]MBB5840048.1 CubicO group peptidase (beta-lactamase class C family) [Kribbella italica]